MAYQAVPPSYPVSSAQYSDWIIRVGALLIDRAPIFAGWIVIVILDAIIQSTAVAVLLYLVGLVGSLGWEVYNRWMMGGQGQSLGKKVLNIMLVSEQTGQPIGAMNAFLRDLCHIIDGAICYIGFLFPLWDAKRQTIADKIMGTVVIPSR